MSSGQWTVLGLLVLLVGLEAARSQNVRDFFKQFQSTFNTALNQQGKK